MTDTSLHYQSIKVTVPAGEQVHLTRLYRDKEALGSPVFMVHGLLQDSSVFFDGQGNGLACYLARQGYDVFVADLRGKGNSWPATHSNSITGTHEHINEDIPALLNKIVAIRGSVAQIWVGHGWGSVLLSAYFARSKKPLAPVVQILHIGSRRYSAMSSLLQRFVFQGLWRWLGGICIALNGYLPSQFLCLGKCIESGADYRDYMAWSRQLAWLDQKDGFDYAAAIKKSPLPPSLYIASQGDTIYGNVIDVRAYIKELGRHDARLLLLDKDTGGRHNYKHNELALHADAELDHFPLLLAWLKEYQC